ncbi:MAG: hypothetical protein LBI58_06140 [Tannerellaceae bacterium]|jgi:hypothetical protein|nr:hypothetical protein [Tannerellaceae bacterium]
MKMNEKEIGSDPHRGDPHRGDPLRPLFKRLDPVGLPPSFNDKVMEEVRKAQRRRVKRSERLGLLSAALASAAIITLALIVLSHTGAGHIKWPAPDLSAFDLSSIYFSSIDLSTLNLSTLPLYTYVGALSLLLLWMDYLLRRAYRKHRP